MGMIGHKCPTCGADEGLPCRTPSGRKTASWHNTRPFSLTFDGPNIALTTTEIQRLREQLQPLMDLFNPDKERR